MLKPTEKSDFIYRKNKKETDKMSNTISTVLAEVRTRSFRRVPAGEGS
ncbi:MAG: hypothetical protein IMW92_09925 [Bacillales bacterium]|nr:hypothetical protein [Bacillales bacterium]